MNAGRLSGMTFKHVDIDLPHLDRETIDGVRYYKIPDEEELIKLVSITSITSHYNKQIFIDWRKRVGTETADKITKAATSRGTDMHTLTEHYLKNDDKLPEVQPLSDFLFKIYVREQISTCTFVKWLLFCFSSLRSSQVGGHSLQI